MINMQHSSNFLCTFFEKKLDKNLTKNEIKIMSRALKMRIEYQNYLYIPKPLLTIIGVYTQNAAVKSLSERS